jgi:predicted MFS family arabinose efflux permease
MRSTPTAQRVTGSPPPLRRNAAFQLIWAGSAAASLGNAVADVAYPLAILAATRSPAQAGLFGAVQAGGLLAAGLPGGQLADRWDQRRILVIADGGRALVTAVVAAAVAGGWLSLPLLVTAAALLGMGQAVTGPPRLMLLRAAVPPSQVSRALVQDEVRMSGADLAGPPLGGALYGVRALGHAVPFAWTAVSFVVSMLSAALLKLPCPSPAAPADGGGTPGTAGRGARGMLSGARYLWADRQVRAVTLLIMMVNTIAAGLTLIIVVILRDQSVPPAMIGLALAGEAAGALAGTTLVRPLQRLRPGVLLVAVCIPLAAVLALLALPFGPWWVASLLFVSMLGAPAIRVLLDVMIFRRAPADTRGRVIAATLTLMSLGVPAGAATAGLLLELMPAPAAVLSLAAALAAGVTGCAAQPALWQARWP